MAVTWRKLAYEDDVITKTFYDAFTIVYSDVDNTPAALTVGASTIVGRKAAGGIVALTAAEVRTIINVADGATANTKATGAEVDTGTDDVKFVTSKALKDSHNVPDVAPGAIGNVVVSDGTFWTSAAPSVGSHALSAHTAAVANLNLAGYQINDQVLQTVADEAAVTGYATPVVGKVLFATATLAAYICTSAA